MTARTSDRPAGVPPVAPAGPATSSASQEGDVAAPGLPPAPRQAGRPGALKAPASTVNPPAVGAGQIPAAGKNAAAKSGKGSLPRPAAGFNSLAMAMSEAELEEHVRDIAKDLGVIRFHVRNSRGTNAGLPDDILIGPGGVLWRECKTQKGKLTGAQWAAGDALVLAGQDWNTWRPADLLDGTITRELAAISRLGRAA